MPCPGTPAAPAPRESRRGARRWEFVVNVGREGKAMGELRQVHVPDIGDFKDVPIIEIQVKVGDRVGVEAPLITLESDKASMDVPSPAAGVVKSLAVKVGDKVSASTPILTMEVDGAGGVAEA